MGIPSDLKEAWASRRKSPLIASPHESGVPESESSVQEAIVSGFKNASIAGIVAAGPVLVGCRVIPWAKANLNYTAQALLISGAAISAFFITADKTILERAKSNSRAKFDKSS